MLTARVLECISRPGGGDAGR